MMHLSHVSLSVLTKMFVHWSKWIQIFPATTDREWSYHTARSVHYIMLQIGVWWAVVMDTSCLSTHAKKHTRRRHLGFFVEQFSYLVMKKGKGSTHTEEGWELVVVCV